MRILHFPFSMIVLSALLSGCAHQAPKKEVAASVPVAVSPENAPFPLREPSAVTPVDPIPLEIVHRDIILESTPQKPQYDLPLDVYYSQFSAPTTALEHQKLVFYFGPSSEDFSSRLKELDFHGVFVVFKEDPDGQHAQKFLARTGGFDEFCHFFLDKLGKSGWTADYNALDLILIGLANGAETINKIGANPSNFLKSQAAAAGFFDGQFVNSAPGGIAGVENIIENAPVGFKAYAIGYKVSATEHSKQFSLFNNINDKEQSTSVISIENVVEDVDSQTVSQQKLISTCVPEFIRHLSIVPFISFRCPIQ